MIAGPYGSCWWSRRAVPRVVLAAWSDLAVALVAAATLAASMSVAAAQPSATQPSAAQPSATQALAAQASGSGSSAGNLTPNSAPVVVDGHVLFRVIGTTAFPAAQRAAEIAGRIVALADDRSFDPASLRVQDAAHTTQILAGDRRLVVVTDEDAALEGIDSRAVLAMAWADRIRREVVSYRGERTTDSLLRGGAIVAIDTLLLVVALLGVRRLRRRLTERMNSRIESRLGDLTIRNVPLLHANQVIATARGAMRLLWALVVVGLVFAYLHFALSSFIWTRPFAEAVIAAVLGPLHQMREGVVDALPGLAFVAVLGLVTYWLLRFGRLFFDSVASGTVKLGDFEAEWAGPTYRILRTVVLLFAVVIAYPYLPGSGSDAFKGVSVFAGLMLSLGAAGMIGNLIAGYSMIYRRAFRVGDRIKVGEYVGDVTQIRAMVTHLRTIKNEEVIVPNSKLLGEHVVNYSTLAADEGLILHTTVGIGYETPWRQVEAMLKLAAERTAGVTREPAPFVLLQSLGDFCVVYEINVGVDRAQGMNRVLTELHRNILDVFNEYDVQIMTPAYVHDTDQPKVVPRSQWYLAPARGPEPSPPSPTPGTPDPDALPPRG